MTTLTHVHFMDLLSVINDEYIELVLTVVQLCSISDYIVSCILICQWWLYHYFLSAIPFLGLATPPYNGLDSSIPSFSVSAL